MGSIIDPCVLVGLFFALLATILYKVSLRDAMREIDERIRLVYDFTRTIREGFDWAVRFLFRKAE